MMLWAIVPVKPFRIGKSRLAEALSEPDRYALNRCLLENTLVTIRAVPEIQRILVISRDAQVLAMARGFEAMTIQESKPSDLNSALEKATLVALRFAVQNLLILPADLPLINPPDLQTLATMKTKPMVAIVPDRHHRGTNALLVRPAGLIRYAFGKRSFELHCQAAHRAGAHLEVVESPRLALDLDLPEDLDYMKNTLHLLTVC